MPFGTDLHELNKLIHLIEGKFVVPPSEYDRRFVRGNDATLCLFTWTTCRYCHHAATGAMDAESLEKQREAKATEKTRRACRHYARPPVEWGMQFDCSEERRGEHSVECLLRNQITALRGTARHVATQSSRSDINEAADSAWGDLISPHNRLDDTGTP